MYVKSYDYFAPSQETKKSTYFPQRINQQQQKEQWMMLNKRKMMMMAFLFSWNIADCKSRLEQERVNRLPLILKKQTAHHPPIPILIFEFNKAYPISPFCLHYFHKPSLVCMLHLLHLKPLKHIPLSIALRSMTIYHHHTTTIKYSVAYPHRQYFPT